MNSYWIDSCKGIGDFKKIDRDYAADVCVVGAGICGLSIGYYLAKAGLRVIILDKDGVGEKASGHTTAKITLQHNLVYDYLINSFGAEKALQYFLANKEAISNIKKIIDTENINCDFEVQPNFVYATKTEDIAKIQSEIKAINILNACVEGTEKHESFAEFVTDCGLPFKVAGAIKIDKQAQFHPRKYMLGLARTIKEYGGLIFTNSRVTDCKKDGKGYITYTDGYTVKSKYVVIASHYPFINFPGFHFLKMYQETSYAIAIETKKTLPEGMFINEKEPVLSFRSAKYGDKRLLIIGGGGHKTGYAPENDVNYGYDCLEKEAKKLYPDCNILYKWNTRDCVSLDKVPYIGGFSNFMPNMYVATGFNKWGMTSSNVAANIITDRILGNENKYADIFDSTRLKPVKNRAELKNMVGQVVKSFTSNRIKIPKENLGAIKNDNGGIIDFAGSSIGVYKDKDGNVFAVNPNCSHLGCLLTWNNVDKTWDYPCHGSRFDYTGKNLYDPAFRDLKKYEIE